MTLAKRFHHGFGWATGVCFVGATIGSDVVARVNVVGDSMGRAVSQSIYSALTQLGTLWLLFPFAVVGFLSVFVARMANSAAALLLFGGSVTGLGWQYFWGYWHAQQAIQEQKWTAAALSVGMLPFESLLVLYFAAFFAAVFVVVRLIVRVLRSSRQNT
jgi:hypothetical protein